MKYAIGLCSIIKINASWPDHTDLSIGMVGRGWGHHLHPENPAQPQVACALTGTSSPTHLAENLAASEINLAPADLDALNAFLAKEDARLADAQRVTVRHILAGPLAADPEMVFNDLVYVMETVVSLGVASEGEVMAIFMELFSLRGALDEHAWRKMQGIQHHLRGMISRD